MRRALGAKWAKCRSLTELTRSFVGRQTVNNKIPNCSYGVSDGVRTKEKNQTGREDEECWQGWVENGLRFSFRSWEAITEDVTFKRRLGGGAG